MVRPTRRRQYEEGLVLSTKVKVMRLMGAGMVTLAVVPWLGVSPAAATGGGNEKADKATHESKDKSAKDDAKAKAEADAKAKAEADAKADRKFDAKSDDKAKAAKADKSKSGAKSDKGQKSDKGEKGEHGNPPGNNGTVKIHDDEPEPSPVRKNQPKVCDFHIHGFNFDSASSGTYRIEGHKWGGTPVKSGTWGPADEDGEWRTEVMTLPDGHYKLYVKQTSPETPGGYKHKVFKVRCNTRDRDVDADRHDLDDAQRRHDHGHQHGDPVRRHHHADGQLDRHGHRDRDRHGVPARR